MTLTIRDTSLMAYREEIIPTLGDRQKCVYELLSKEQNLTNSEIAKKLNWPINCVTPRIYELRKMRKVEEDTKRICKVTGRTAYAWKIIKSTLF